MFYDSIKVRLLFGIVILIVFSCSNDSSNASKKGMDKSVAAAEAEEKAAAEAKRLADKKAAAEAKKLADKKAAAEAKKLAEEKAAEAKRLAEEE